MGLEFKVNRLSTSNLHLEEIHLDDGMILGILRSKALPVGTTTQHTAKLMLVVPMLIWQVEDLLQ